VDLLDGDVGDDASTENPGCKGVFGDFPARLSNGAQPKVQNEVRHGLPTFTGKPGNCTIPEKMNLLLIGVILILLGIVLLLVDRQNRRRGRRSTVSASHGSVAVGGNSNAPIINASTVAGPEPSGHLLKVIGIIVELGGIAAVIWHATHLAGK
jgi:uncharacterized membrane protein